MVVSPVITTRRLTIYLELVVCKKKKQIVKRLMKTSGWWFWCYDRGLEIVFSYWSLYLWWFFGFQGFFFFKKRWPWRTHEWYKENMWWHRLWPRKKTILESTSFILREKFKLEKFFLIQVDFEKPPFEFFKFIYQLIKISLWVIF